MAVSPDIAVAAMVLAPFLAALLAPVIWRATGVTAGWLLALVPAAICAELVTLVPAIAAGRPLLVDLQWAPAYGIDLSFAIDGLSLVFDLSIAGIGTLILIYSGAYLKGHPQQGYFLALMLAFTGAMQGLVLSDGLVPLYVFWELTTFVSFLLIGFDHGRQSARRAALQALIVTGAGGLCLLLGALMLHLVAGQWTLSAMAGQGRAIVANGLYAPIVVLVFLAAFTKSAQVPFHFWLPNAMEAPTPVSAYLHSATMVQAGIYLLARLSPLLGATPGWTTTLVLFGGATLLWGALGMLKETDLKQLLAQSTIASLGLLVLLIGLGSEVALGAAIVYFLAHALYKAGFFLIVGVLDHETGIRDLTALGGLRDKMALSFIAAILAGFAMLGLPPTLAYLAKEELYTAAAGPLHWAVFLVPLVLVAGNAALGAAAIALVARPFMGPLVPTPKSPHEGPFAMLVGPLLLGIAGIATAALGGLTGAALIAPATMAMVGHAVASHLGFRFDMADPALWLSLATWILAGLIYWRLDAIRAVLRRFDGAMGWTADAAFDAQMAGLLRLAAGFSRTWQSGSLRFYLLVIFLFLAIGLIWPLVLLGGLALPGAVPSLDIAEWGVLALAVVGLAAVIFAPTLLIGILALGIQGLALALIFLLFGAPDLSFTQFMVETLSVVMFALLMARLRLDRRDRRTPLTAARDAIVAVLCGAGTTALLLAVLARPFGDRLGTFFAANAVELAHGHNIVNVILVDFRGLDTLGEISVVFAAGIAILALLAGGRRTAAADPKPRRVRGRRKPEAAP